MSHLKEWLVLIKRRQAAIAELAAATVAIQLQFPIGSRIEFDRGDCELCAGSIVAIDCNTTAVKADIADIGPWLAQTREHVFVPWTLLFTAEAAIELHKVRDPIHKAIALADGG